MRLTLSCAALLLLSGCVNLFPKPAGTAADEAKLCKGDALASFAGRPGTAETGAAILKASGASVLQWVPAGTMVTMDFRANRVRIYLDASGKVERASCG